MRGQKRRQSFTAGPHSQKWAVQTTAMQRWLLTLSAAGFASAISYLWFDQAIALLVHVQFPQPDAFARLTHIPEPFIPLAVIMFIAIGLGCLSGRTLSKFHAA